MSEISIVDKSIVVPGEVLAEDLGVIPGKNCFRVGEKVFSKVIGIADVKARVINVIPLVGRFMPVRGDQILGCVLEVQNNGWQVDIGAPYNAFLPLSEFPYEFGGRRVETGDLLEKSDIIFAEVIRYSKQKDLILSMKGGKYHSLKGGRLIFMSSQKVPRLIGKQGSMISLIKKGTNMNIYVGSNGWVWLKDDDINNELRAVKAVDYINKHSHEHGLTEKVEELLKKGV